MKKFIQNALAPIVILSAGLLLIACEPMPESSAEEMQTTESDDVLIKASNDTAKTSSADVKSGNMFYIVRDVADMQLKAGEYVNQLKNTQTDLQSAINDKDQQQLQATAHTLQQQLTDFNQALRGLNLKSQEIDSIRQEIMRSNQQVLATPLLNGAVDFSQVDFKKIERQMSNIQMEMLKLASMMIPQSQNSADDDAPDQAS
ncbi:hypothetical protein SE27_02720 [Acinetobacter harbinensis]|uniref:hypothetical protein n=1 Tax=Acinetobacter harbinensis TaxID=1353941 RepID=UPI000580017D|nr:hypothetical protein [Acinetobacter harbinensis]KWQ04268.1 hypothetical protein SE27_02720 [Acinetobacter harbinensis]